MLPATMDIVHALPSPSGAGDFADWQRACAALVQSGPGPARPGLIGAADVAYENDDSRAYAAVVVVERDTWRQVEMQSFCGPPPHPYQSGRFSLREAECLVPALCELETRPDVMVIDGHGIAHPRRFGLACHIGVMFDIPTVGCAKNPLFGAVAELDGERGATAPIRDDDDILGMAVRTQERVKPVYVSPGHRFDVTSAAALILSLAPRYRIPEPLRRAHHMSITLRADDPRPAG